MPKLEKRIQILLDEEQYEFLKKMSKDKHKTVSEIIRFAIDNSYRPSISLKAIQAYNRLISYKLISIDKIIEDS